MIFMKAPFVSEDNVFTSRQGRFSPLPPGSDLLINFIALQLSEYHEITLSFFILIGYSDRV